MTLGFQRVAQPEPVRKEDLSTMCNYDSEVSEVDMKGCKHAVFWTRHVHHNMAIDRRQRRVCMQVVVNLVRMREYYPDEVCPRILVWREVRIMCCAMKIKAGDS